MWILHYLHHNQAHTLKTWIFTCVFTFSPFYCSIKAYRVLDIELTMRLQVYLALDPCGVVFSIQDDHVSCYLHSFHNTTKHGRIKLDKWPLNLCLLWLTITKLAH
jgi:hypothetical protein